MKTALCAARARGGGVFTPKTVCSIELKFCMPILIVDVSWHRKFHVNRVNGSKVTAAQNYAEPLEVPLLQASVLAARDPTKREGPVTVMCNT